MQATKQRPCGADSFGPHGVNAQTVSGCYQYHGCGGLCIVCPTCVYQFPATDDCPCAAPCIAGVPAALCCVWICSCERDGNAWVGAAVFGQVTILSGTVLGSLTISYIE